MIGVEWIEKLKRCYNSALPEALRQREPSEFDAFFDEEWDFEY